LRSPKFFVDVGISF